MNAPAVMRIAAAALLAIAAAGGTMPGVAADGLTRIRMTIDEHPIVPQLAASLGYLEDEGIEIVPVDIASLSRHDFLLQQPLIDGRIDASYHWFNHAVFGARHNLPIRAIMLFNDAPGMTLLVANRLKDEIASAADFKARNVAEGAGYGTKSLITGYLTSKAGLPPRSYTPVMMESAGRQGAVLNRRIDVDALYTNRFVKRAMHAIPDVSRASSAARARPRR